MKFLQNQVVLHFPSTESQPPLTCEMIRSDVQNKEQMNVDILNQIVILHVVNVVDMLPIKQVCNLSHDEDQKLVHQVCTRVLFKSEFMKARIEDIYQYSLIAYVKSRNKLSKLDGISAMKKLDEYFHAEQIESSKKTYAALDLLDKECQEMIGNIVDTNVAYTE